MAKLKTIYYVSTEMYGEQDFFFDAKGKLLTWWDRNDAHFRSEYMKPLFQELGFQVERGQWYDPRWKELIKQTLIDCGASEGDFGE